MGRRVIRNMWRVEQEHDVIGTFYHVRVWQQEGTAENTSGEPSYEQDWLSRPGARPRARLSTACGNMGGS